MDWHATLETLRAAVTSDPGGKRPPRAGTPGKQASPEGQADEMLLADWANDEIKKQRGDLAKAMGEAKKPHKARLLEEPHFPELRAYLLGNPDKAPEPELQLQEPRLLKALAVWLLGRPLDEPQDGYVLKDRLWFFPQIEERRAKGVLDLARALRRNEQAALARRLLQQRLWRDERFPRKMRGEIIHELALCISMSPDLAPGPRFDSAFELLKGFGYLKYRAPEAGVDLRPDETGKKSERTRYVAWIHRQRSESNRQRSDFEKAALWYQRAWEESRKESPDADPTGQLRNAADAAYCYDLLREFPKAEEIRLKALKKAASEGKTDPPAKVKSKPLLHYRWLLNLAKLEIGLQARQDLAHQDLQWVQFLKPLALLTEAAELGRKENLPAWIQTRKAQEIARTRGAKDIHLGALLDPGSLPDKQGDSEDAFIGSLFPGVLKPKPYQVEWLSSPSKVGLGLSGGGFRASLFHLGVLASLAERDLLKRVEVLSCVSGGSIVGAHFYLKLRHLLTVKRDADIEREDYIELVRELIHEFLAGVQKNVRTRVVANPLANLRMLLTPYTRSSRAGDLMDRHLFRRVRDDPADEDAYWRLCDLRVEPADQPQGFHPERDNWKRVHKVPILTLNAASLNTGHSWQFAATWMGEPPSAIEPEVDCNDRLRRMKLEKEAPPPHGQTRLGQAVAASACVPGLFEPSTLRQLYKGKLVRLVDGGVFDNQGIAGLVEQGCSIFLVSDASGQMEAQDRPHGGLLGSLFRANTVLMDRIRQTQYQNLRARQRTGYLDKLLYVHLKQDLEVKTIDWLGCDDPKDPKTSKPTDETPPYGIPKDTQALLAGIRTDLDSFCDAEAYALMYSGYQMMTLKSEEAAVAAELPAADWPFLCVEPRLRKKLEPGPLKSVLTVSGKGAFKIWRLWFGKPVAKWAAGAVALLPLAWLSSFYISWWGGTWKAGDEAALSVSTTVLGLVPLVAVALFLLPPLRAVVGRTLNLVVFGVLGMVVAWVHLAVFDPLYLHRGRELGGFARRLLHESEATEGKVKRARKIFERLVAKSPRDWLAQVGLWRALTKLEDHQKAREKMFAAQSELERQIEDLDEQDRLTGPQRHRLGELRKRKKYVERLVVADYTRRIKGDRANAELRRSRGDLLLALEEWKEARVDYDRAIELEPKNAECLQGRGDTLKALELYEEALDDYNRAIDLGRKEAACFKGRGETLNKLGRPEEALKAYDRAIELEPKNAECFQGRGETLKALKLYEEALAAYDRAIELDPENEWLKIDRGDIKNQLDQDGDSKKQLDQGENLLFG